MKQRSFVYLMDTLQQLLLRIGTIETIEQCDVLRTSNNETYTESSARSPNVFHTL